MAQWLGQFSGDTHDTRVKDVEAALRQAVHTFKSTPPGPERHRKAKSVRNLAKRLLSARLRALKARLVAMQRVATEEAFEQRATEIASLRKREELVSAQGIAGILEELDAGDALAGAR